MNRRSVVRLAIASALVLPGTLKARAVRAADVSAADRAFVAHVSQGGMFEVEASKLGSHAEAQNVVDQAVTEVHDHELVGAKLKRIAESLGLPFPSALDAAFSKRLAALAALSGKAFDHAYILEMDAVHASDVQAFANEAAHGTNPALVAFAAQTVLIVRRHIGALQAIPVPTA